MLTGEIKNQVDRIWLSFFAGGIANPMEVMEQMTYLLFIRRLDELQLLAENRANATGKPIEQRWYPEGQDARGVDYSEMRWSSFKNKAPAEMYEIVSEHVFPLLRELGGKDTAYTKHMAEARLTIPTPALLATVVDQLDQVEMKGRDTKGDVYEYMLNKMAADGYGGTFRTPRHIIQMMVEMVQPSGMDTICDPACGTCGFLVAAGEYLRRTDKNLLHDARSREHFHNQMFTGYDFDRTMLRVGSMNMILHGVDNPRILQQDSLSMDHASEANKYSLVLANPPFAGSVNPATIAKDLSSVVDTRKTELLFLALFLRIMKPGGRAAVIVPDGVLFGSGKAHRTLRKMLVEDHKLEAVVSLPSGTFKPYAGVSTAILFFTKTNSGGTDNVWFYDVKADGWSLDDKRTQLLPDEKVGPLAELTVEEHAKNNLPDVLKRWAERTTTEKERSRTAQSFVVPKADIAAKDYDLSLNRYKEVEHEAVEHRDPKEILAELWKLEDEIQKGMKDLEAML